MTPKQTELEQKIEKLNWGKITEDGDEFCRITKGELKAILEEYGEEQKQNCWKGFISEESPQRGILNAPPPETGLSET